jgi:hypothetical protein
VNGSKIENSDAVVAARRPPRLSILFPDDQYQDRCAAADTRERSPFAEGLLASSPATINICTRASTLSIRPAPACASCRSW